MKVTSLIARRPVCWFIIIIVAAVLIPILLIPFLDISNKRVENDAKLSSDYVNEEAFLSLKAVVQFMFPINSSAVTLARLIHSSLNATKPSLQMVEDKVSPNLYLSLKMLPLSQVTFIGSNGVFYSYYIDGNQTFVAYANASSAQEVTDAQNASIVYNCHTEPVDGETGRVHKGKGFSSNISVDSSWFQGLKSSNAYNLLGKSWAKTHQLFFSIVNIDGIGLVSLGLPVKAFSDAISRVKLHDSELYLVTKDGTMFAQTGNLNIQINDSRVLIADDKAVQSGKTIDITCNLTNSPVRTKYAHISRSFLMVYCALFDIAGVPSAMVMVFPDRGIANRVHKHRIQVLVLLFTLLMIVLLSACFFMSLIVNFGRIEMSLSASLVKQMESTLQAERKSMNKTTAFCSASHDMRSTLAGINGLISRCLDEVAPKSELYRNLQDMKKCAADLRGLLNSILDVSKIEAGKMQLVEEEFDIAEVLEDSANFYYPVGKEKGIDVVLDPCDQSVLKHCLVKGDCGRFKQILNNLIHNAIKFTSEGSVSIRAWAEKPSLEKKILSSKNSSVWSHFMRPKDNEPRNDLGSLHSIQQQESMEFVIEVDDTGKGIPREKHKSVFEDFIQVKGTALEHGGTGLGLGIVQSLVRLMGGEIGIKDKESMGERGTCFRFNVFFSACEITTATVTEREDVKLLFDYIPAESPNHQSEMHIRSHSPTSEGSQIVLFMQGGERRKMLQKFFESLGTNVGTVDSLEPLLSVLNKIKAKWCINLSRSGKYDLGSLSGGYSSNSYGSGTKGGSPSVIYGTENVIPHYRKTSSRKNLRFVLFVIDFSWANFSDHQFTELYSILENFRRDSNDFRCKVVWLYTPHPDLGRRRVEEKRLPYCEIVMGKPFHGTRLYQVLRLLPEFGGAQTIQGYVPNHTQDRTEPSAHPTLSNHVTTSGPSSPKSHQEHEIQPVGLDNDKPLLGKRVLVGEDSDMMRRFGKKLLDKLGAQSEFCENGVEVVELVRKALKEMNQNTHGASKVFLYDYILMDCEMPKMTGYEATTQIRIEERRYNIHIPIIALTAHEGKEEEVKSKLAGMDYHLQKPLEEKTLLKAIHSAQNSLNI